MCFGGRLMRGNRCQKTHSSFYQAFDTLTYPYLANLGVDVDWNREALLTVQGVYRPRFEVRSFAGMLSVGSLNKNKFTVARLMRIYAVHVVSGTECGAAQHAGGTLRHAQLRRNAGGCASCESCHWQDC